MDINKRISQFTVVEATDDTTQIPVVQGSPLFNAIITPEKMVKSVAIPLKKEMNLNKVDNTSDLDKPISNATQELFDGAMVDFIAGENVRKSNENIRITSEENRKDAEISRKSKETIRESNETTRINKETIRISNESDRVDAEIVREQQEQARQTNTATAITNAENAITDVNTAKDDYYDVVKPDIIAQGEYATAQGDYAKAQGEAVEGTVSSINNNTLTIEEVTAMAIVAMQNRIVALEKVLSEGILDKIKIMNLDIIDNFNVWGQSNLILTGTSAPSVIPDFTGQTFIDTTNKVAYTATGNNSVLDWK